MPEAAPPIPDTPSVGLATKLGAAVGALASLLAVLAPVLDGDQTPETLGGLAVAGLAFYAVIRGRSDQAAAITVAKGAAVAAEVQSKPATATLPPGTEFFYSGRDVAQPWPVSRSMTPTEYAAQYPEARDEQALEEVAAEELAEVSPVQDPGALPLDAGDGPAAETEDATPLPQADGPNAGSI